MIKFIKNWITNKDIKMLYSNGRISSIEAKNIIATRKFLIFTTIILLLIIVVLP